MANGDQRDNAPIDQRGSLASEPFAFRKTSKGAVFISWEGKPVTTLNGSAAERFLAHIDDREGAAAQLVMAKVTGNFKRGNERVSKQLGRQ